MTIILYFTIIYFAIGPIANIDTQPPFRPSDDE